MPVGASALCTMQNTDRRRKKNKCAINNENRIWSLTKPLFTMPAVASALPGAVGEKLIIPTGYKGWYATTA